ncbi:DNA/RNA non-specific endonuclease [Vagococcus sp. JNUCC 83]
MRKKKIFLTILTTIIFLLGACGNVRTVLKDLEPNNSTNNKIKVATQEQPDRFKIEYAGGYQEIVVDNNIPSFTDDELSLNKGVWQTFSDLDQLNRVGVANALIGKESFPKEKREGLSFKPTGWHQKRLDDGQWLYNRSHLIGFQLTGENDNPKNLMTGTRSLNTPHMLNYENQVKTYIETTENHVRYRVTPIFKENELLARGVQLEAKSIEDDTFSFNVYIYNIQEGYDLNYTSGESTKS